MAVFRRAVAWWTLCFSVAFSFEFETISNPWRDDITYGSSNRKHDWCAEAKALFGEKAANLSKDLPRALQRKSVSLVFMMSTKDDPFFSYDNNTGRILGGYLAEIVEEISRRTGLNWHDSFAIVDGPGPEGYDEWLRWATGKYDVVVGNFAQTPHRRAAGFRLGFPFQSNSPTIITHLEKTEPTMFDKLFAWSRPFHASCWLALLACFSLTAFAYQYVEEGQRDFSTKNFGAGTPSNTAKFKTIGLARHGTADVTDQQGFNGVFHRHFHSLYLSIGQITRGAKLAPATRFGKTMVSFWAFTCLLITSMYTANLASLLVVRPVPWLFVRNVDDAIAREIPLCIWPGGAFDGLLQDLYPNLKIKYPKHFGYDAIRDGSCGGLVKDYSMWQVDQGLYKVNGACDLNVAGEVLAEMSSGFISGDDESVLCGGMVMDIMSYAMSQMHSDGWFHQYRHRFLSQAHDQSCGADDREPEKSHQSKALTLHDLGGVYIMYLFVLVACILGHVAVNCGSGSVAVPGNSGNSTELGDELIIQTDLRE